MAFLSIDIGIKYLYITSSSLKWELEVSRAQAINT